MAFTIMTRAITAILLISLLTLTKAQIRTINAAGIGTVTTPPDLATIRTGVVTTATTAMEAVDANSKALENVLDVLKSKGIAEKDIQTTSFNLSPQTQVNNTEIVEYRASNQVVVKVRDIDMLGEILDALVTAGSNRISSVTFSVADPKPLQDEARKAAVADAVSRAELYATAANVSLGRIISISERPISPPTPKTSGFSSDTVARSVPIVTGELDISATVFILFAIA